MGNSSAYESLPPYENKKVQMKLNKATRNPLLSRHKLFINTVLQFSEIDKAIGKLFDTGFAYIYCPHIAYLDQQHGTWDELKLKNTNYIVVYYFYKEDTIRKRYMELSKQQAELLFPLSSSQSPSQLLPSSK